MILGMNTTYSLRRLSVTLAAAAALAVTVAACGGDDDDADSTTTVATSAAPTGSDASTAPAADVDAFCQAEIAVEAAVASEDPAVMAPAFEALSAAAPAEIKPSVDAAVTAASSGQENSPEFATAYGELIQYVQGNCGFGELEVTGSEYAFGGVPESLAAGPVVVTFTNTGSEFHEFALMRVNEGVTETAEELLALSEEEAMTKVTPAGGAFAAPGEDGYTVVDLTTGRYLAVCFVPEGATPENMPAIEAGTHEGAPHAMLGMVQEFTVA